MMKNNKRVLVVSNNCFSPSNSNGRTLGNLFYGWPKENLAQFCVIAQDPMWELCDNYYCLEDQTVLNAFMHCKKAVGRRLVKQDTTSDSPTAVDTQRKHVGRKTLPRIMMREMVWAAKRWQSKDFEQWVNDFNPDLVVLQFGDSSFMIDIALSVAKSRNIPLVVYNTEGYYFFNKFWYYRSAWDAVFFPLFKHGYRKSVRRLMQYAAHSVYLNDELKEDYDDEFHKPSTVIYNSSSMQRFISPLFADKVPHISYLGGLGHGRDLAIMDVGEVLQSIDTRFYIDVYGPAMESVVKKIKISAGVRYHGTVSYDTVKEVMGKSDILFHVEPSSDSDNQLRYGFSTKIADSVISGKCFVLYTPKDLACAKYVFDNHCGWTAETKDDLRDVLLRVINNKQEREKILEQAQIVAQKNHSYEGNARKFQNILLNV